MLNRQWSVMLRPRIQVPRTTECILLEVFAEMHSLAQRACIHSGQTYSKCLFNEVAKRSFGVTPTNLSTIWPPLKINTVGIELML